MNWRWYITGLIIALAFCGVSLDQSSTDPNQEIVVLFASNSITANEAKDAISEITTQLKSIGVEDVQVSEVVNGRVKVTYYSTFDVTVIKNLLYKKNKLDLSDTAFNDKNGSSKIPFGKGSNTYKLEVIKIQKDLGSDVGFQGLLVEVKSFADQYLKPTLSEAVSEIHFNPKNNFERVDCTIYSNVILLIDTTTTHKIPEVRAGPLG